MNAKLYKVDGTVTDIAPADPKEGFTLDELYKAIGCELVQVIDAGPGMIAIMDEEGRLKDDVRVNVTASRIVTAGLDKLGRVLIGSYLVGNVIICDGELLK